MIRVIEYLVAWEFQLLSTLSTRKLGLKAMKDASIIDNRALPAVLMGQTSTPSHLDSSHREKNFATLSQARARRVAE
jgi:hypothetical protein